MYSVNQVLNFTPEDLEETKFLEVEGWSSLPEELREECLTKIRDLVNQRDQMLQSQPIDASELEDKLLHISSSSRSRSSSYFSTPPPEDHNDPIVIERELSAEKTAYDTLMDEGGRPSHPIDLGFDIYQNPREYKDIISYWEHAYWEPKAAWGLFLNQLTCWRKFRDFQQEVRSYNLKRGTFSIHQREVNQRRRRHGLHGNVVLRQVRDQQGKLENWMEYQDYHYQNLEKLQRESQEIEEKLHASKKLLGDAEIPNFEGLCESVDVGAIYSLSVQQSNLEWDATNHRVTAEEELEWSMKRLGMAQSESLEDPVREDTWVRVAQAQVDMVQNQLDTIQQSRGGPNWSWELAHKCYLMQKELKSAEKILKAAQSDFEAVIEKPTLVSLLQEEVLRAQSKLEELKKSEEKIDLRGKFITTLKGVSTINRKIQRHQILLKWIEEQRQTISSENAGSAQHAERGGAYTHTKKPRGSSLRNSFSFGSNQFRGSKRDNLRRRGQNKPRSALASANPSRISKPIRQKSSRPHWKTSVKRDILLATNNAAIEYRESVSSSSEPEYNGNERMTMFFRPIHSSRLSKLRRAHGYKRFPKIHMAISTPPTNHSKKRVTAFEVPDKSLGCGKPITRCMSTVRQPRRSTRISRRPERFCPG